MKITKNANLSEFTSLRVGGPAENLIQLEAGDDLGEILLGQNLQKPIWILGSGTNSLISDSGLPGTVIANHGGSINFDGQKVKVSSGCNWDEFVQATIKNGLWGLEFTSGIPGDAGAAVAGNIAAYGQQIAERLVSAAVFDLTSRQIKTWLNNDFSFSYRSSSMQLPTNQDKIILNATFQLASQPTDDLEYGSALKAADDLGLKPDSLENRRQIILEARRRAGSLLDDNSLGPWTAGSFFKNPLVSESQIDQIIKHDESGVSSEQLLRQNLIHGQNKARVSAAHVLLAAGFRRGQTWGQVRLHPDHILKIENLGGATAQEIYSVVQQIIDIVHEKLGIALEPEVRFLGEF